MSSIDTNSTIFQDLSIARKNQQAEKGSDELGQKAFLKLMITQLENQDPLSPQENAEFISQLAQFSSVESLDSLNNNFDSFTQNFVANQALQASSLVGTSVSVETDEAILDVGSAVAAVVDVPQSSGDVNLNIYTESGELVEQMSLGTVPAGELNFRWNGQFAEVDGELLDWQSSHEEGLPPGKYSFEFTSAVEGEKTQLTTYLSANVNSVTVGASGALTLNLAGVGAVGLDDVKQFN